MDCNSQSHLGFVWGSRLLEKQLRSENDLSSSTAGKRVGLSVCVCVRKIFTNTLALSSTDMQQLDVEMAVGCGGEILLNTRSGLEKDRESLAESSPYVEEAGEHLWAHPGSRADDRTYVSKT